MQAQGQRVPFVQRCARTGEVIGTTSYYDIDEVNRSSRIGYTMFGRSRWRTGVNTEAKLLLLTHAFETLGAVRVEWHTDTRNERSQRAIERLGATREGVLRRHRLRADGTWRDTVQYSMTDAEWPKRTAAPAGNSSRQPEPVAAEDVDHARRHRPLDLRARHDRDRAAARARTRSTSSPSRPGSACGPATGRRPGSSSATGC